MKKIIAELFEYRNEKRIKLIFGYNAGAIEKAKTISDARWSKTLNCWHVPYNKETIERLKIIFPEIKSHKTAISNKTKYDKNVVSSEITEHLQEFKKYMLQKRYSNSTIKTYTDALKSFFVFYKNKNADEITNNDLVVFNNEYILKNNLSASYQNQIINAVKLFYTKQIKKEIEVEIIERPRKSYKLPNVLSKEEITKILKAPKNIKHKAMLSLIYSCGLRRSEFLNLKPTDVDSKRNLLLIRNAKGMKDRVVPLSDKIIEMLRTYYKQYKPKTWLFEGQEAQEQYSGTSLQNVFKHALRNTNIKRNATLHWLRHSYATHLLESGTDLRYIQEILGHKSSKTTEIYTHVTNKSIQKIKSPFDELDI